MVKFKGFLIEEVPDDLFQTGEVAYVYIDGVGKAFTGINTARTIESEDFDGVALQGAGKAGEFILPDNKKAVCKVLLNSEYGLDNLTVTSAPKWRSHHHDPALLESTHHQSCQTADPC